MTRHNGWGPDSSLISLCTRRSLMDSHSVKSHEGRGIQHTHDKGAKVVQMVLYLQISQRKTVKSYYHTTGKTRERWNIGKQRDSKKM